MKESKLKVYKFCAFCAPSCQTIGAGPVSRASLVGFNAVIPFLLALKRYDAFGREELLVYNRPLKMTSGLDIRALICRAVKQRDRAKRCDAVDWALLKKTDSAYRFLQKFHETSCYMS